MSCTTCTAGIIVIDITPILKTIFQIFTAKWSLRPTWGGLHISFNTGGCDPLWGELPPPTPAIRCRVFFTAGWSLRPTSGVKDRVYSGVKYEGMGVVYPIYDRPCFDPIKKYYKQSSRYSRKMEPRTEYTLICEMTTLAAFFFRHLVEAWPRVRQWTRVITVADLEARATLPQERKLVLILMMLYRTWTLIWN